MVVRSCLPRRTLRNPKRRIRRSTVQRATAMPSRCYWCQTLRTPFGMSLTGVHGRRYAVGQSATLCRSDRPRRRPSAGRYRRLRLHVAVERCLGDFRISLVWRSSLTWSSRALTRSRSLVVMSSHMLLSISLRFTHSSNVADTQPIFGAID